MSVNSVNCERCGKKLTSEESRRRGYGSTCYKIISYQNKKKWKLRVRKGLNTLKYRKKRKIIIQKRVPEVHLETINISLLNITDRLRKVELDNSYLKARTENITIGKVHVDDAIERIKREESQKITDPTLQQYRNVFHECIKDLKDALKQGTGYLKEGKEYEPEITKEISIAELKAKHKKSYIDVQQLKIVRER